jgi:hypothetical protein
MPGPISGYGGGTSNIEGSQATPVEGGAFNLPALDDPALREQGVGAAPGNFYGASQPSSLADAPKKGQTATGSLGMFGGLKQRAQAARQQSLEAIANPDLAAIQDEPNPNLLADAPRLPPGTTQGMPNPQLLQMLGEAPKLAPKWQRVARDVMTGLAAFARYQEGDYAAGDRMMGRLAEAKGAARAARSSYENARQIAQLPGMNEREFAAYLTNPEQWAANMSDALSTHHAAANVGQSETRVYGNPRQGGAVYQPTRLIENGDDHLRYDPMTGAVTTAVDGMTQGEQYAQSLGVQRGSPEWNNAVRDAELGGNGPTAFDYDQQLEGVRHNNRMSLEERQQRDRLQVRGTPTYRDANPLPARPRASGAGGSGGGSSSRPRAQKRLTAVGPGGQKIEFNGTAWVPVK